MAAPLKPAKVTCRIYLFTYKRNDLLVRAVDSLLAQTHADWVCELHNDDPGDPFPGAYIISINDPRLCVIDHPVNLGPTKAFNLAFYPCKEAFISILEDDNWWEPDFLATMLSMMDKYKQVQLAWANMHIWEERPGHNWTNTGKTIWPQSGDQITLFESGHYRQAYTALHSNGAMLVRNTRLGQFIIPENVRSDYFEAVRERACIHPLLLVRKPLANFSLTVSTSRAKTLAGTYEHSLLLIDSFFKSVPIHETHITALWKEARADQYRSYLRLMYAGLLCRSARALLRHAGFKEWTVFILYNLKKPYIIFNCLNAKKKYPGLWQYLLLNTHTNFSLR